MTKQAKGTKGVASATEYQRDDRHGFKLRLNSFRFAPGEVPLEADREHTVRVEFQLDYSQQYKENEGSPWFGSVRASLGRHGDLGEAVGPVTVEGVEELLTNTLVLLRRRDAGAAARVVQAYLQDQAEEAAKQAEEAKAEAMEKALRARLYAEGIEGYVRVSMPGRRKDQHFFLRWFKDEKAYKLYASTSPRAKPKFVQPSTKDLKAALRALLGVDKEWNLGVAVWDLEGEFLKHVSAYEPNLRDVVGEAASEA